MPKIKPDAYQEFLKGLWRENPVFVQVLGMCPTLAVTNSAENALVMGGATFFVLLGSSGLVSALQRWIPKQVRISKQKLNYYKLTFEVTDLESGLLAWTTEKEFARQASQPLIGW